jgi:hypothetical protein
MGPPDSDFQSLSGGLYCSRSFHRSPGETHTMSLEDIQAVIASAKARGIDHLEGFIRHRAPEMSEAKVVEAAEVALEIIESVPIFLARASQEARHRQMGCAYRCPSRPDRSRSLPGHRSRVVAHLSARRAG